MSLGRLMKGLLITTDARGVLALRIVPAGLLIGIGLFFSDQALVASVVIALAEENRGWSRTLPPAARAVWWAFWVLLFGFLAWTVYRFDW